MSRSPQYNTNPYGIGDPFDLNRYGFSDWLSSNQPSVQGLVDWTTQAMPTIGRRSSDAGGGYWGPDAFADFRSDLEGTPLFADASLEPMFFTGDYFQHYGGGGNRSGQRFAPTIDYHPYGMVHVGAAPEQATLGAIQRNTDPNWTGWNTSAQRYFDPSTQSTFDLIRRGGIGYVYNRTPSQSSLAAGESPDATTNVGDATTDTTTGETTVGDPAITDTTVTTTTGDTPVTDVTTTDDSGVGLTGTTGTGTSDMPLTYQNLLGGWGMNQGGGYSYNPGFNLPEPQYPVPGDRPTFSDYTNDQIIRSLRAEHNWSMPGVTEGTFREQEGWDVKSDQDILDFMAGKPASWLQEKHEDFRAPALAQMGEDDSQRAEFQTRTQAADILNLANQGFLGSMGMIQDYGRGAMQEVGKNYLRNIGRGRAGLASRGMTGTTVYDAMVRGAGEQSMQDYLNVQDAITGRKIQTYQQGIGGIVNALNSIQYRTMHPMEYANLYQAFGEGGAGAAVPEAPSTTNSALLGTALGIATPLLFNAFGPLGAVAGGLLGSVASAGGNVLDDIGDFLEDTWDAVTDWF